MAGGHNPKIARTQSSSNLYGILGSSMTHRSLGEASFSPDQDPAEAAPASSRSSASPRPPSAWAKRATAAMSLAAAANFLEACAMPEHLFEQTTPDRAASTPESAVERKFQGFASSWGQINPSIMNGVGADIHGREPAIAADFIDIARLIPASRAPQSMSPQDVITAVDTADRVGRMNAAQLRTVMESASRLVRAGRVEPRDVRFLIRQITNRNPDAYQDRNRAQEPYRAVDLHEAFTEGQIALLTAYLQEGQAQTPPADQGDRAEAIRTSGEMSEEAYRALYAQVASNGRLDREVILAIYQRLENQNINTFDRFVASLEATIPLAWVQHCASSDHPTVAPAEAVPAAAPRAEPQTGYTIPTTAATMPPGGTRIDVASAGRHHGHHRHHREN